MGNPTYFSDMPSHGEVVDKNEAIFYAVNFISIFTTLLFCSNVAQSLQPLWSHFQLVLPFVPFSSILFFLAFKTCDCPPLQVSKKNMASSSISGSIFVVTQNQMARADPSGSTIAYCRAIVSVSSGVFTFKISDWQPPENSYPWGKGKLANKCAAKENW